MKSGDNRKQRWCSFCKTLQGPGHPKMKQCNRCKVDHYCSHKCQEKHWPHHKNACVLLDLSIKINSKIVGRLQRMVFDIMSKARTSERNSIAETTLLNFLKKHKDNVVVICYEGEEPEPTRELLLRGIEKSLSCLSSRDIRVFVKIMPELVDIGRTTLLCKSWCRKEGKCVGGTVHALDRHVHSITLKVDISLSL